MHKYLRPLKPHLYLAVFLLLISPYSSGITQETSINIKMKSIGEAMGSLFLLAVNDKQFFDERNTALINANLLTVAKNLEEVEPHFNHRSITYQVSYEVIRKHISEIQKAVSHREMTHAQSMLRATASICTSCHTQDRKQRTLFKGFPRKNFSSDYEFAEFNFITRNYGPALEYYNKYFTELKTNQSEQFQLKALHNILTVYAQVYNTPGKAAQVLKSYLDDKTISTYAHKQIESWIEGLAILEKENSNSDKMEFPKIERYVDEFLNPNVGPFRTEYHVWLRGLLFRYLDNNPKSAHTPDILYWLSLTDRITSQSFYYSLGDLYLKQCILGYTDMPIAKKCFKEYEEYINFSYSGSLGTDIPDDVQKEMETLRRKVYGKAKP